jgi:hypothetical protein
MRTSLFATVLALLVLAAVAGCQQFFKPWGSGTSIDSLTGYRLGTPQSQIDLTAFTLPSQPSFKNPDAKVTINGETFPATLTLTFADGALSEIRIVKENISGEELQKLQSAAFNEIRSTYSKSLVTFKSNSYDLTLRDAVGHTLKLVTTEPSLADNDGVFDYAISIQQMAQ